MLDNVSNFFEPCFSISSEKKQENEGPALARMHVGNLVSFRLYLLPLC